VPRRTKTVTTGRWSFEVCVDCDKTLEHCLCEEEECYCDDDVCNWRCDDDD
jgi:hypothetical protein